MNDILLNDERVPLIENGDFVVKEATLQHQQLLLLSSKGDFKENPTIGVGAPGFLKEEDEGGLLAEIKKELERDGMSVEKIVLEKDILHINAAYK